MPIYTYRREDGTTFDLRQRFFEEPLQSCPNTGQTVNRVIQPAGIIFKGSGFYVNDNNKANNPASPTTGNGESKPNKETAKADAKPETKTESKSVKREKVPAAD